MSTRLQVLLDDQELEQLRSAARRDRMTVSEWVRRALRAAMRGKPGVDSAKKLAVIHAAMEHSFPAPEIDEMLAEIERGYAPPESE